MYQYTNQKNTAAQGRNTFEGFIYLQLRVIRR